jgi:hypothetical protein
MNDKKKTTYYQDQLAKIAGDGVSFLFFGGVGSNYFPKTNQMDLNEESAKAIVDLLTKLNLYNPNPTELLEQQYACFDQGKNVSEKAFRTVLAYKYWQDGAEWDFVCEVWYQDPEWTREKCMKVLSETFNYGGDK